MASEANNFGCDGQPPYPVPETAPSSPLPTQEQGAEPMTCTCRLYDVSQSPWRSGGYVLKCMPKNLDEEITEAMATLNSVAHPKGFTNLGNEHYTWNVKLKEFLEVEVIVLDGLNWNDNYTLNFTSEQKFTRSQILSQPSSRLPSNCASVEFAIFSKCKKRSERQFRVIVKTDIERVTRDYNVMFTRPGKPQEPEERPQRRSPRPCF